MRSVRRVIMILAVVVLGFTVMSGVVQADPSASASDTPTPGVETAANNWLWALGGVLVVLLVFLGWRFILSGRR